MDLDYIGYGTLYLDIIANKTLPGRLASKRRKDTPKVPIKFTGEPYATPLLAALYLTPNNYYEKSLRASLGHRLSPSLPEQNFTKTELLVHDLQLSWQSNIHVWIVPWYHEDDVTNVAVSELFSHPWLTNTNTDHKIMLYYNVPERVDVAKNATLSPETLVASDIQYLCDRYLLHSAYFTSKSRRPVLVLSGLTQEWIEDRQLLWAVIDTIRSVALGNGIGIFLLGDQVWSDISAQQQSSKYPLDLLDGIVPLNGMYDEIWRATVNGDSDVLDSEATLDSFYDRQLRLRIAAWQSNGAFIPTVIPGYNGRISGKGNRPLARGMKGGSESEGALFVSCLNRAKHLLDPQLHDLLVINSFNNFFDDSQIYPVYGYPSDSPKILTDGLWYEGYGETYLDILSKLFGGNPTSKTYVKRKEELLPSTKQADLTNWCSARRRRIFSNSTRR